MKMTAPELKELGVVDGIIPEPAGGAHLAPQIVYEEIDRAISHHLAQLSRQKGHVLAQQRYQKFRNMIQPAKKNNTKEKTGA